jgi:hypothetical protein
MSTDRQCEANRKNAGKSTGPRSRGGKWRASQNARTHGLYAAKAILKGCELELYFLLRRDAYKTYRPVGALEEQIVEQITMHMLRLVRMDRAETSLIDGMSSLAAARRITDVNAAGRAVAGYLLMPEQVIVESYFRSGQEVPRTEDDVQTGLGNLVSDEHKIRAMEATSRIRKATLQAIRTCEKRLRSLRKMKAARADCCSELG